LLQRNYTVTNKKRQVGCSKQKRIVTMARSSSRTREVRGDKVASNQSLDPTHLNLQTRFHQATGQVKAAQARFSSSAR